MVRILTDSSADFSEELARQLNVEVLPLGVTFEDGTAYRDRVDLQPEEFYEKLAACEKLPKTSQPNLGDVLTAFENARDAGDEMVAIFISSQLSGTYQSACMAADTVEYPGIHVVDSLNAAMGQHLLVRLAVRLRDEGFSATQIAARLDREKHRVCQLACGQPEIPAQGRPPFRRSRRGRRPAGHQAGHLLGGWARSSWRPGPRPARRLCGHVQAH